MNLKIIAGRIKEDLNNLEQFTATPGKGCTRLPFTPEARAAVNFLKQRMTDAGLSVREDAAGNVIGILPGENPELPCVMMGSHYDSVVNGGNFDGIAGVVSAIETARQLKERGVQQKRNYVAVGFCDEEGTRFGTGFFGSGAILGHRDEEYCKGFRDKNGISISEAMQEYGLNPSEIETAKWPQGAIGTFIEAHVEQGPVLDTEQIELGLVEWIVGIQRYMVTIFGRADHAGTTPMDMRKDPVEAAAKVIAQIPAWARSKHDGTVATVGYINVKPGGVNIIADEVEFSVDIRSRSNEHINEIVRNMEQALQSAVKQFDGSFRIETKLTAAPVKMSERLTEILEQACQSRNFSFRRMLSGAGHDALEIGQEIPSAMVFVASKDGRSHCPIESSKYEDLAKASIVATDLIELLLTKE